MTDNSIDMSALQELKLVMEDEFSVLINTYLTDSCLRLDALQLALSNQQAEEVRRTAHSFKGSSANVGALGLAELLRQIEECGREAQLEKAVALLAEVQCEYAQVKSLMEQCALLNNPELVQVLK